MSCPETPRRDHPEDLGFTRREMVAWFDPRQLADTAVRAGLSIVFGAYADRREVQAALTDPPVYDEFAGGDDIWIDYIADLGDGWDSTYTMARLLGQETCELEVDDGRHLTHRGRFLVLGGDQVYPTAKREEYRDRFIGPYRAALPCVIDNEPPGLFAIPGNHDWYDGLTSFTRIFLQGRWIGGWKTRQSRSYFAIRLPHDWWLWGIDIQLGSDIDGPQLKYFEKVASGAFEGEPRDDYLKNQRIILCTASPSWVYAARGEKDAYSNLEYFERKMIRKFGGELAVTLTGDLHHYTRYYDMAGRQKITSGGGGAYLYGTHDLPKQLNLGEDGTSFTQTRSPFPSRKESKGLARRAWRFAFLPKNFSFTALLGSMYLLYSWILQSASKRVNVARLLEAGEGVTFMERIQNLPLGLEGVSGVLREYVGVIAHSPVSVVLPLVVVVGLVGFCDARSRLGKWLLGGAHGLGHVAINIGLIWAFAFLNLAQFGLGVDSLAQIALFLLEMLVVGGVLGGLLMGLYLALSNRLFGLHTNEVFSAQGIPDYKNFIRLHLDNEGRLSIYPIGVRRVVRRWRLVPEASGGAAWFEPEESTIEPELIEGPITLESE